ncbi:MAG: Phosphoglycerate mutase [Clostridia bacterium]|nr:Phosphoglycerate mutase [Clostridia bacterium]
MLKLYIVRHGETEFNVQKRMQGRIDSPLTQRGIEHAIALGNHLQEVKFDKIYTSPSPRAYRTAEFIVGDGNKPIEIENELREMNLADWEGKTKEELETQDPAVYDVFWNSPHLFKPTEGESFYQVQDRALAVINKLISENESGNILIVTHSVVIKTIVAYFKQYSMEKLWAPPLIHDTSVTILGIESGEAKLETIGDATHII